jgi:hypothetical protein
MGTIVPGVNAVSVLLFGNIIVYTVNAWQTELNAVIGPCDQAAYTSSAP